MSSLVDYKGLQVVSPEPTGDGGLAIQNDFKNLVDWNPRSVWAQTADPTATNDETEEFYPGSMWLRTNVTPPKLFVCRSSADGAAVWSQVALTANAVPYSGATGEVNLVPYRMISRGLNAGFSAATAITTARVEGYWFARTGDLGAGWMLDYQDEFAFRNWKGATITASPAPSQGSVGNLLVNDTTNIQYSNGTSPGTIVLELDTSANPVPQSGNGNYAVGLTFRSGAVGANPTHIKIEFQSTSTSYETVYDENVTTISGYDAWVSTLEAAPGSPPDIAKVRVTLTVPSPLPADMRIQRLMLYHSTAAYDPWKISSVGGISHGPLQIAGPLSTATATKTANYTLGHFDSVVLADSTSAALTMTLPSASGRNGWQYTIKRINSGSNNITIATSASQTIDGSATKVLTTQYEKIVVVSNGANWWIIG